MEGFAFNAACQQVGIDILEEGDEVNILFDEVVFQTVHSVSKVGCVSDLQSLVAHFVIDGVADSGDNLVLGGPELQQTDGLRQNIGIFPRVFPFGRI